MLPFAYIIKEKKVIILLKTCSIWFEKQFPVINVIK